MHCFLYLYHLMLMLESFSFPIGWHHWAIINCNHYWKDESTMLLYRILRWWRDYVSQVEETCAFSSAHLNLISTSSSLTPLTPLPPQNKIHNHPKKKIRLEFEQKKKLNKYRNACTNLQLGPTLLSDEL